MVYLASPYTNIDILVCIERFHAACRAAAHLMKQGEIVFAPICHSHPIHAIGGLAGDWETWKKFDEAMIRRCDKIIVLTLDGWERSVGIKAELEIAEMLCLPIEYMDPV